MATTELSAYERAVAAVRDGSRPEAEAEALYDQLSEDERLGLLDGDPPFWDGMATMMTEGYNIRPFVHGEVARLGIPGVRFGDGPRGCMVGEGATAFPVSMARGATWDVDLEEAVGRVIGREIRAQDGNFFAGVCINLPRHPAWGRAQETYGEEPVLLGELGAALTRGAREYVMACAKHYALNSMENARFQVDVLADDATLHEIYLPHFKRVVDEGVDALMTAYNSVNGEWCGQSPTLITDILRDLWGFEGITVSDFLFGLRDAAASLEAGLDIEEPFQQQRAQYLRGDIEAGRTSWEAVRRAGVRILSTQLRYDATHDVEVPALDVVACEEHRALAREVASRSMVLLRNEPVDGTPVLPFDGSQLSSLAVIGRLADLPNTGDRGSSNVRAPYVVTALEGLRTALPDTRIVHVAEDDPEAARRAAAACDAAVVVAGYTYEDEGEYTDPSAMFGDDLQRLFPPKDDDHDGAAADLAVAGSESVAVGGDRARLTLRPIDEELILAVADANPRTVVAIVAAGAVLTEAWRTRVPGVVMAWYAGMEGGHGLADVLLGRADPSGRLPFSIPTDEAHLPEFDRDATSITYDRWHGQRLLDRLGVEPAYPLGFGLSYTTFELRATSADRVGDDALTVDVEVANTGPRDGRHVVQVYGRVGTERDAERHLLGFAAVAVAAGTTATLQVPASLVPLASWDPAARRRVVPAQAVTVQVSAYAGDPAASEITVAPA